METADRVIQRLKLRDLRLLDTVVRWKSMAKAAGQLNMTQPAVSKAIAELERMVGARLLDRNRQGIEVTPHGRALLRRGAAMFDEIRQGIAELEHLSDPTAGEVRVATSEPHAASFLPILIDRMSRQYPRISVYVAHLPIGSLQSRLPQYRELHERNVDLVLGPIIKPFSDDSLESEILFEDRPIVAAGNNHKWARRRNIALADLIDEPWCLQPVETIVGATHIEAFRSIGLRVPAQLTISISVQVQIGLLDTQRFLTILPNSLIHFGAKRFAIKALPIRLSATPFTIGIVTLRNRFISPAAQRLIQAAREVTRPLAIASRK